MGCELLGGLDWRALAAELDRLVLWLLRLQQQRDELVKGG